MNFLMFNVENTQRPETRDIVCVCLIFIFILYLFTEMMSKKKEKLENEWNLSYFHHFFSISRPFSIFMTRFIIVTSAWRCSLVFAVAFVFVYMNWTWLSVAFLSVHCGIINCNHRNEKEFAQGLYAMKLHESGDNVDYHKR